MDLSRNSSQHLKRKEDKPHTEKNKPIAALNKKGTAKTTSFATLLKKPTQTMESSSSSESTSDCNKECDSSSDEVEKISVLEKTKIKSTPTSTGQKKKINSLQETSDKISK